MSETKDWPLEAWLRLAVIHLHIDPDQFWAMPVRDWLWLLRKDDTHRFSSKTLADLMTAYPDEGDTHAKPE